MKFIGAIFFLFLGSLPGWAADFGCADVRLNNVSMTFEQAADLFGEAHASGNDNCLIAYSNHMVQKMDEFDTSNAEHLQQYMAAMRYLGETKNLSTEARREIGEHLQNVFVDENFLTFYLAQQDKIENESAFYSTAVLLGLTGVGMTGEWFLRSAFSLGLQNSPTRIVRSAGLRGLRRLGVDFIRAPQLPRLRPRLFARGLGGTANGNRIKAATSTPILDLKLSPMYLAGLADLKTSLSYSTFWQTFSQQAGKWTGAAAMGFASGVGFGHLAHKGYQSMGLTKLASDTIEKVEKLRKIMLIIRANQFASKAANMTAAALEPVAFAASTVATLFTLRGLELWIQNIKWNEVTSTLEELKTKVRAANAAGEGHSDYKVFVGVNLIVDQVRMLEALSVSQELLNQLDISNQYIISTANEPICRQIRGLSVDLEKTRAIALVRLNSLMTYANIIAKPKYDAVQNIYDANIKFIASLKEPYLDSALARLATMKTASAATLDTDALLEILQDTSEGQYEELKARLETEPGKVEKEISCHKPMEFLPDPKIVYPF